jgi:hypothetical protein
VILAGAALALLGPFVTATAAEAAPPTGALKIQNETSLLCLTPAGGSTVNNVEIVQYSCQLLTSRTYTVQYNTGQHAYQIVNENSGKCLSPAAGSTGLNVAIVQFTCDNDKSRYWNVVKRSGYWTLQNLKSELCLSPAGGGTGLNTVIVQYTCDGNAARNWYVFGAWEMYDSIPINPTNPDYNCATIAGSSRTLNTVAVTYTCNASEDPARLWDMMATSTPNSVMIRNVGTGLCLSPAGAATTVGTLVVQYRCDGQPPRLWQRTDLGEDSARIVNNNGGLCLAADGGGLNDALIMSTCGDYHFDDFWFVYPIVY